MKTYSEDILYEYNRWLKKADNDTVQSLKAMSDAEVSEAFCQSLEFGTGGLRGIMGVGTNRLNIYTVRQATQGLADEITEQGLCDKGVVIAFDSRNNSKEFAYECARVLCANGIKTYLFDDLRPTPELSFAVRYLSCARGIVITASHNPKEYNGYKVYGEDGGQIPPSVAERIIKHIKATDIFDDVKLCENPYFTEIGKEVDEAYIKAVMAESMGISIPGDFKVVYTPLHGSGNRLVRAVLERIGVKNLLVVPEQEKPNGNFPTVKSPNPENIEAFDIATGYAKKTNADLVFGTDPDSDRIGVVVRIKDGTFKALNGNQTGMLICEFLLRKLKEKNAITRKHTVIKTIVTTDLVSKIASDYGASVIDVLTGFKFIGEKIHEFERSGENEFLFGMEESYGYLKGKYTRDKDAVVAAMLICEMAADYKSSGKTLYDGLLDIYEKYGYTQNGLISVTLKDMDGAIRIKEIMERLRYDTPNEIADYRVEKVTDYLNENTGLPKSNVLKFILDKGWFAVRPSGTEPKIKFYYEIEAKQGESVDKKMNEFLNGYLNVKDV